MSFLCPLLGHGIASGACSQIPKRMHSWGDPENLTEGRSERSERFEKEILWAEPGKQKERVVQGAWLTPEAVPSERERNGHNGECRAELDCLGGDAETNFE